MTSVQKAMIISLYDQGQLQTEIAEQLEISNTSVSTVLKNEVVQSRFCVILGTKCNDIVGCKRCKLRRLVKKYPDRVVINKEADNARI